MTTRNLLEEYANIIYNIRVDPKYRYNTIGRTLEGIEKELEASIRKEVVEEIIQYSNYGDAYLKGVSEYALSKGITLK